MGRTRSIDRDHVLDTAEALMLARGASALTIDALAKAVGISKGGIQSCFGTKENILAALLQRWTAAYEQARQDIARSAPDGPLGAVQQHARVTAQAQALNQRAAAVLAALLQSQAPAAMLQDWYQAQLAGIDPRTDDGRRARLAFLATEGAFLLRYLGLARFEAAQWQDIFTDIDRCARPAP